MTSTVWTDDERSKVGSLTTSSVSCPTTNFDMGTMLRTLHQELEDEKYNNFENDPGHMYYWELDSEFEFPDDYCQSTTPSASSTRSDYFDEVNLEEDINLSSDVEADSDEIPCTSKFADT